MSEIPFVIYNKNNNTFMHYNPFTKVYFESENIIGSIGWTKDEGTRFILDNLTKGYVLRQYKNIGVTKINNDKDIEKEYFNLNH